MRRHRFLLRIEFPGYGVSVEQVVFDGEPALREFLLGSDDFELVHIFQLKVKKSLYFFPSGTAFVFGN